MIPASLLFSVFAIALIIVASLVHWRLRRSDTGRGLPWYVWTIMLAIMASGIAIADSQARYAQDRIEQSLVGLAPTYANSLIEHGLLSINLETKADDPTYLDLIDRQKLYLALNPAIADLYVFEMDREGKVRLLVDSETDYDRNGIYEGEREARTPIGELYENVYPALQRCFAHGWSGFDRNPSTDRWGTWVSAVHAITNDEGQTIAVLGIDYPAKAWVDTINSTRTNVLAVTAAICLIIIAASAAISALKGAIARQDELMAALKAREEAAHAGNEAKSAFLAHMSHEIRTPVTAIVGYADLISSHTVSEAERAEHLQTIVRNGHHLLTVINDILDLASIEAGRLNIHTQAVEPASIVAEVASLLDGRAKAKGLRLNLGVSFPVPASIDVDPTRLKQVLVNIIGNAVKFTERGSVTVAISANLIDQIIIDVIDTGVGIKPDQAHALFKPFVQGDAGMDRRFGGTGLGLAISRKLTRNMGGDISITSEVGKGSRFRISLPIRPGTPMVRSIESLMCELPIIAPAEPSAEATAEPAAEAALANAATASSPAPLALESTDPTRRVLLAEDGPDNQRLISFHLRKEGWHVTIAADGVQAVRLATEARDEGRPFVLIFMDMQMPELDGYGAARALRDAGFKTPIVALTAHAAPGSADKCLAAGCDDYAVKPVNRAQLAALAAKWVTTAVPAAA